MARLAAVTRQVPIWCHLPAQSCARRLPGVDRRQSRRLPCVAVPRPGCCLQRTQSSLQFFANVPVQSVVCTYGVHTYSLHLCLLAHPLLLHLAEACTDASRDWSTSRSQPSFVDESGAIMHVSLKHTSFEKFLYSGACTEYISSRWPGFSHESHESHESRPSPTLQPSHRVKSALST